MSLIDLLLEQIIEMLVTDVRVFMVFVAAILFIMTVASVQIGNVRYGRFKRYDLLYSERPKDVIWKAKRDFEFGLASFFVVVVPLVSLAAFALLALALTR